MSARWYAELVDPDGETYEDGSRALLISAEHPATYPTRDDKISLHLDCVDIDIDARQIRWLVEQAPVMLARLEDQRSVRDISELRGLLRESAAPGRPPEDWLLVALPGLRAVVEILPLLELADPGSEAQRLLAEHVRYRLSVHIAAALELLGSLERAYDLHGPIAGDRLSNADAAAALQRLTELVHTGPNASYAPCECGAWPTPRDARDGRCRVCWNYRPASWHQTSPDPTEGGAATTPVEARGTSSAARDSRRGRNPSAVTARAAGAQLTGQRQDGSSQAPADEQDPAPAHGGRRPSGGARG